MVYKQGDLDMACGLYAIVNAIGHILPDYDGDAWFNSRKALKRLGPKGAMKLLQGGLFVNEIEEALNNFSEIYDNSFTVKRPFRNTAINDAEDYFSLMKDKIGRSPDYSAIIFFKTKRYDPDYVFRHWIGISDASPKRLYAIDSYTHDIRHIDLSSSRIIKRHDMKTDDNFCIWPTATFVLQRTAK